MWPYCPDMAITVRLRNQEVYRGWNLRSAARWVQTVAGLAVLVNVASFFLNDDTASSRGIVLINFAVVIGTFSTLTGGFIAEKIAQRGRAE